MRADNRVVAESGKDSKTPTRERAESPLFFQRDGSSNTGVRLTVASIEAVISNHFEMFFRDVTDQSFDKVHGRDGFVDKTVVFVPVVMERDGIGILVVGINSGSSNDRATKITTDVFEDSRRAAFAAFGIDVETVLGVSVNRGLYPFKFGREHFLEQIQEDGLERFAEEGVVEVRDRAPETKLVDTAFGNKTVDMWIPFEVTAKGMQNTDETGDEMARVIEVKEQT